jgi:DNA-damage-inducible protein J
LADFKWLKIRIIGNWQNRMEGVAHRQLEYGAGYSGLPMRVLTAKSCAGRIPVGLDWTGLVMFSHHRQSAPMPPLDRISIEIYNKKYKGVKEGPIMTAHTSMLHVRVDEKVKKAAAANLASVGLTISEAVRVLLTRVAEEGGLPPEFISRPEKYDTWFKAKVRQALNDGGPGEPFDEAMPKP